MIDSCVDKLIKNLSSPNALGLSRRGMAKAILSSKLIIMDDAQFELFMTTPMPNGVEWVKFLKSPYPDIFIEVLPHGNGCPDTKGEKKELLGMQIGFIDDPSDSFKQACIHDWSTPDDWKSTDDIEGMKRLPDKKIDLLDS